MCRTYIEARAAKRGYRVEQDGVEEVRRPPTWFGSTRSQTAGRDLRGNRGGVFANALIRVPCERFDLRDHGRRGT